MLPSLKTIDVAKKRVFLRLDLNVPIEDKKIVQDFRLQQALPTLDYLQKQECKIVLATHIGRPSPAKSYEPIDENLSTKLFIPWFEKHGYAIDFERDLEQAIEKSKYGSSDKILLLENLRFFEHERETNNEFAELLAQLADVYVNDAFGVLHRFDTSVTLLPQQFKRTNRAFGFLVEKELTTLQNLKQNSKKPFVIICGGSKAKTKINVFENFLKQPKSNQISTILVGGALANTFLKAERFEVGSSKIEKSALLVAQNFLEDAQTCGVNVILPIDGETTPNFETKQTTTHTIESIPHNQMIVDIGPKTISLFSKYIDSAQTIFANGTMGIYEKDKYAEGSKAILKAISTSSAYTVIGGGDAVAATIKFGFGNEMDFLSTGGGATLAVLASNSPETDLPALAAMNIKIDTKNDQQN